MSIKINESPMSREAINLLKDEITAQITVIEVKKRRAIYLRYFAVVLMLLGAIVSNALYSWVPWGQLFIFGVVGVFVAGSLVSVGALIGSEYGAAFAVAVPGVVATFFGAAFAYSGAAAVDGVVIPVVGAVAVAVIFALSYYIEICAMSANKLRQKLSALGDSSKEDCLLIAEWLSDTEIAAFRDAVLREGRVFTIGEVAAMDAYFSGLKERDQERLREEEVNLANRKVYVNT